MEDTAKAIVTIWGDSQTCDHHFLKEAFLENYKSSWYFSAPSFDSQSGRKMNEDLVQSIHHDMNLKSGLDRIQIHIILVGTNSLTGKQYQDLLPFYRQILEHGFANCKVLLCGFLPRPKTDKKTKLRFSETSAKLKALSREPQYANHAFYLAIQRLFTRYDSIDEDCFRDGVHLSKSGAQKLAYNIFDYLNLRKTWFQA